MKIALFYFNKEQLEMKLGVRSKHFIISDVKSNFIELEFSVVVGNIKDEKTGKSEMGFASVYFTREDVAKNLGVKENQIAFGRVEHDFNSVQFELIFDSEVALSDKHLVELKDATCSTLLRRQLYEFD